MNSLDANVIKCHSRSGAQWLVLTMLIGLIMMSRSALAQFHNEQIITGADQVDEYLDDLLGKSVGMVANHTTRIGSVHLVDSLVSRKVHIKRIFSPEHGFRGNADAGELVANKLDPQTGIPIISLYGKNKKPYPEQLEGIDIIVFDMQDVGARFYTYISTMHYVMEACAENNVPIIILDRPNPNGHYVDGPIREPKYKSFVGMHPVPIVHGMTIGEYARMINGERWLAGNKTCELTVVQMKGYDHNSFYRLPRKPSPNLPNMHSVYLYPSLCLFEGTIMSVGRGTDEPFQVIGHPDFTIGSYQFTPRSIPGASKNPKLLGRTCYGISLAQTNIRDLQELDALNLEWLISAYQTVPNKKEFFSSFFNKLAGNSALRQQIVDGASEDEIRESWAQGLDEFKKIREKYLLYRDFEERIDPK